MENLRVRVLLIDIFLGGGIRLDPRTIICEVRCEDGKVYKVRGFVSNGYVIEMNQRIVQTPQLLANKVFYTLFTHHYSVSPRAT